MDEREFSQLPPAAQTYIREIEARNRQLGERVRYLAEQFRLAQHKRFAPSSEKLQDRAFNEAEQVATEDLDEDVSRCLQIFPVSVSSTICPKSRRPAPAAATQCIVWARKSANNCISR